MTPTQLRQLQLVELQILLAIDKICIENGIEYFLDSGTMLGAARHGGFIPWDDDIDIAMPRDSYERFLSIGQAALGNEYYLQTRETDPGVPFSFAKVRMNGTEMVERVANNATTHNGIWVDIFPFDIVEGSRRNLMAKRRQWRFWHRLYTTRQSSLTSPGSSLLKRIGKVVAHALLLPIPLDFIISRLDGLADKNVSDENAVLVCFHYYSAFVPLRIKDVYPLGRMPFEGHELSVLNGWERYLEMTYGNWRELPPLEERRVHDILRLVLPEVNSFEDMGQGNSENRD